MEERENICILGRLFVSRFWGHNSTRCSLSPPHDFCKRKISPRKVFTFAWRVDFR